MVLLLLTAVMVWTAPAFAPVNSNRPPTKASPAPVPCDQLAPLPFILRLFLFTRGCRRAVPTEYTPPS